MSFSTRGALQLSAELDKFERQMKRDVPKAAGQAGDKAARGFDAHLHGCGSTRPRPGAWRGRMQAGAAAKEPPCTVQLIPG